MSTAGLTVDIITGFLGSGKTTLLKQVLSRGMGDKRVAVIVNEIGRDRHRRSPDRVHERRADDRTRQRLHLLHGQLSVRHGRALHHRDGQSASARHRDDGARRSVPTRRRSPQRRPQARRGHHGHRLGQRPRADERGVGRARSDRSRRFPGASTRRTSSVRASSQRSNARCVATTAAPSRSRRPTERSTPKCCLRRAPEPIANGSNAQRPTGSGCGPIPAHEGQRRACGAGATHLVERSRSPRSPLKVLRPSIVRSLRETAPKAPRERSIAQRAWCSSRAKSWPSLFNYTCGRYDFDWCPLPSGNNFRSQGVFIGKQIERTKPKILDALESCKAQ